MKQYLIGIDGGASRSRAILTDRRGTRITAGDGGILNPLVLDDAQFRRNLQELIDTLLTGISREEVHGLCAGLAGTGREPVRKRVEEQIGAMLPGAEVVVISDALAALWGAFKGSAGLLLIAGTGSICMGLDDVGRIERAGGFGRILGDEGSGYWIALEGLKAALQTLDGRSPYTVLVETLKPALGFDDLRDAIPWVNDPKTSTQDLARLAEVVLQSADADATARQIVTAAGAALAGLVIAVTAKLDMENPGVALWGGLWNDPQARLQNALQEEFTRQSFKCRICPAAEPAEWGAVRYLLAGNR